MPVFHGIARDLRDALAVDQVPHGDQHAVPEHRMVGREPQIAARLAGAETVAGDADGPNVGRPRMLGARDEAMAEPHDARRAAPGERHIVADG
jgi:hypothetical protein